MVLERTNPLNLYYECNKIFEFKLPFGAKIQRTYKTRNIGKLYQASKTLDFDIIEKILNSSIDEAIEIGNNLGEYQRKDWFKIKKEVVLSLLLLKSKYEKRFREELHNFNFQKNNIEKTEYTEVLYEVLKELKKSIENAIDKTPELLNEVIEEVKQDTYLSIEELRKNINKIPKLVIINTDKDNSASKSYIKSKITELEKFNIKIILKEININILEEEIKKLNKDENIDLILLQLPLKNNINPDYYLNLISPDKDVDRLNNMFVYSNNPYNLPLTSQGILEIINKLSKKLNFTNILFIGNGLTTNRKLFMYMFNNIKEYDYRIVNSKTSKTEVEKDIEWADLIISATGKNHLRCKGKIVISPSIIKNKENKFEGDLIKDFKKYNLTHNTLGKIGKLTVAKLIESIYYLMNSKNL